MSQRGVSRCERLRACVRKHRPLCTLLMLVACALSALQARAQTDPAPELERPAAPESQPTPAAEASRSAESSATSSSPGGLTRSRSAGMPEASGIDADPQRILDLPDLVPPPPPLAQFPQELGRNFVNLFQRDNLKPLVLGFGAAALAHPLDDPLASYFSDPERLDDVAHTGDLLGTPLVMLGSVGGLFVASRFSDDTRFQSFAYSLAQAAVLNKALTVGLKAAIGRTRPNGKNDLSFPSGHSSASFMFASVIDEYYGRKAGLAAYATASYIAFSRLEGNDHHLSDVIAGATIGYIVGRSVARRQLDPGRRARWSVGPAVGPDGGVGLEVGYSF